MKFWFWLFLGQHDVKLEWTPQSSFCSKEKLFQSFSVFRKRQNFCSRNFHLHFFSHFWKLSTIIWQRETLDFVEKAISSKHKKITFFFVCYFWMSFISETSTRKHFYCILRWQSDETICAFQLEIHISSSKFMKDLIGL